LRIGIVSGTTVGKISNGCLLASFVAFGVFFAFVASGQRGGEAFYSNALLALPMTVAVACGAAAAVFAVWEVFAQQATSLVALVSIAFGSLIVVFVVGELTQPH